MITPTKDYRMSKGAKVLLSGIADAHERGELKRFIIQAELHEKAHRQSKLRMSVETNEGDNMFRQLVMTMVTPEEMNKKIEKIKASVKKTDPKTDTGQ